MAERYAIALRPLADVFAIAAAKLVALAVNVVDDVTLFRPSRLDCSGRHFSNFGRSEGYAAFQGAARKSYGYRRRPKNRHDANQGRDRESLSANVHRIGLPVRLRFRHLNAPPIIAKNR